MNSSFFEIGGRVVESITEDLTYSQQDEYIYDLVYRDIQPEDVGVALADTAVARIRGDNVEFIPHLPKNIRKAGRARRAKQAATIAVALAAADGPLPIADLVAIGFLSGYAGYEVYRIITD